MKGGVDPDSIWSGCSDLDEYLVITTGPIRCDFIYADVLKLGKSIFLLRDINA